MRQIVSCAVVSDEVIDIFSAAGLKRPDIGVLSHEFLEDVRHMKERHLVELLERLLKGKTKSRFKSNVVQRAEISELLQQSLTPYQNRAVETAQAFEKLIEIAKKSEAAARGESLGMTPDETALYDALAANEAAVRDLRDNPQEDGSRTHAQPAQVGDCRLGKARGGQGSSPARRGAHASEAFQVPARPAGRRNRDGTEASRIVIC